nr:pentatricopeptide repeat-containing protein At1g61870, mitochondrial-like [Ipomoea batatas]
MAATIRSKLRSITLHHQPHFRRFATSILNPDSKTPFSSKDKSRAALSLIRTETNPERIIDICRAASLTPESHLDRIAYSKAIAKLRNSSYFGGIREFLEESKSQPGFRSERFISHFVVLYGQAGMLNDAIQTFEQMEEMGIQRSVKSLNSLLFSCLAAKNYGEMKRIFVEFPKKYGIIPNLDTYNTMIEGFCDSGSSSSVYSILDEMIRNKVKPNATTFGNCLSGFYMEEKFEDVGKILEMMKQHGVASGIGTYNIRIESLCKLKRSKEAKALLDGILSRGVKPNSVTYTHLIHGFCKEGEMEGAKSLFKEMVDNGCQPGSECYFTMVYFLCKGKDFETAVNICKESMAKGWVPNFTTMKLLVDGLASTSKVEEAKEIIGQLKEKFSRNADRWTEIEEGLAKSNFHTGKRFFQNSRSVFGASAILVAHESSIIKDPAARDRVEALQLVLNFGLWLLESKGPNFATEAMYRGLLVDRFLGFAIWVSGRNLETEFNFKPNPFLGIKSELETEKAECCKE